jgi:hypothetical protein
LGEPLKKANDGLEVCHSFKAKELLQNRVMSGHFAMLKAVRPTPD